MIITRDISDARRAQIEKVRPLEDQAERILFYLAERADTLEQFRDEEPWNPGRMIMAAYAIIAADLFAEALLAVDGELR